MTNVAITTDEGITILHTDNEDAICRANELISKANIEVLEEPYCVKDFDLQYYCIVDRVYDLAV